MKQKDENMITSREVRLLEWRNSEEYLTWCTFFEDKGDQLVNFAKEFLLHRKSTLEGIKEKTARTEFASDSGLHRGFYCPSLVYDIIVGNVKRGRRLKGIRSNSKNYFIYGFDGQDKLIWVERYYNGVVAYTEYIAYDNQAIWGITLDSMGRIYTVTKEKYDNGRIQNYLFALVSSYEGLFSCDRLRYEEYVYDDVGLKKSIMHFFHPKGHYEQTIYDFERASGFLSQYTARTYIGKDTNDSNIQQSYDVPIIRKA